MGPAPAMREAMDFKHLTSADGTDTGRKRSHNEDSLLRLPDAGVFCVADGMGGMYGGEVASHAVVAGLQNAFEAAVRDGSADTLAQRAALVRQALNQASSWIKRHGEERGASGAGTTAIVLVCDASRPTRALLLHAGDSRAYCFRRGRLTQLSNDHSVAAAAGLKNEKSLPSMFRGVVTRAVGLEHEVKLEETPVDIEPDDLLLLCSDGLTRMVPDKSIARLLKDGAGGDLQALARTLIAAANDAGGEDNISVVLVRVASTLPAAAETPPTAADTAGATATTRIAAPPAATAPSAAHTAEAGHFDGSTPAGEHAERTPETAEFQKAPPVTSETSQTHVPAPRPPAVLPAAGGNGKAIAGLVLLLLVGTGLFLLLRSGGDSVTVAPPPSPPPATGTPAVAKAPPPPPAPAAPAAVPGNDAAALRASFQVDVREALLTGHWGDLEVTAVALRNRDPAFGRGLTEWTLFEAWSKEWKRAEFGAPPARLLYGTLRDAAVAPLAVAGAELATLPEPAWTGEGAADANSYCAASQALLLHVTEAVDRYVNARAVEIGRFETNLLPVAVRLQRDVTLTNGTPAAALAALRQGLDELRLWGEQAAASRLPPPVSLFAEGERRLTAVESAQDILFDRLVDVIRGWGRAHTADLAAGNAQERELLALFSRVCNMRNRYQSGVRDWRLAEGHESVPAFFRLASEVHPGSN